MFFSLNFWKRRNVEKGFARKIEDVDVQVRQPIQRDYPFHEWEAFKRFRRIWHWRNAFAEFSCLFLWGLVTGVFLVIIIIFLSFFYLDFQIVW